MASARAAPRVVHLLTRTLQIANVRASSAVDWAAVESSSQSKSASNELRSSTSAVANRLYNQEAVKLEPDTPLTLEGALLDSQQARVITSASAPHAVVYVNAAWEQLCKLKAEDVVGRHGLSLLHGPKTNKKTVGKLNAALAEGKRVRVQLVNYKGDGSPFLNKLQVTPLRSKLGEVTHFLGLLQEVEGASLEHLQCEYTSLRHPAL